MGRARVWVEKKRLDRRFDSAGSTAAGSGTSPGLGGFVGGEGACARGKAAEKCIQVGQALQALKVLVGFSVALTHLGKPLLHQRHDHAVRKVLTLERGVLLQYAEEADRAQHSQDE